ncbi:hypothetical protein Q5752_002363 [Cryptotrichosporon argae]
MLKLVTTLLVAYASPAAAYTMISRWGHAATYLASPPALLIQGGKTDPSSTYSYSSAPNTADTLYLPLSSNITSSTPAFTSLASGPSYTWHCLSPLSASSALVFGGDGGSGESVETLADSAWLANVTASAAGWTHEATSWADEPDRRIYHACTADMGGGTVYVTGGEKDDGSGTTYADVYAYDPSTEAFATLAPLPQPLFHHVSALLPNGTLVVLAGAYVSADTDTVTLLSASTVYTLDTTAPAASWQTLTLTGTLPDARRGATASISANGTALLLMGGADAGLVEVYADAWILNLDTLVWTEVAGTGPGARFDHTAVSAGDQVLVFGGYTSSAPADADLYIFDMRSASFVSTFDSASSANSVSSAIDANSTGSASVSVNGDPTTTVLNAVGGASSTTDGDAGTAPTASVSSGDSGSDRTSQSGSITSSSSSRLASSYAAGASGILTTSAKVGLIIGACGFAGLFGCALVWTCCRRRRKASGTYAQSRPYGSREKGGPGLMDTETDAPGPTTPGKPPRPALGLGSIVVPLTGAIGSLRNRVASGDAYARLAEDGGRVPSRWPTRKVGRGIRLVGAPADEAGPSVARARSTRRDTRIDMFADEDEVVDEDVSGDEWADEHERAAAWRARPPSTIPEDDEGTLRLRSRTEPVSAPPQASGQADHALSDAAYLLPLFAPSDPLDLGSLLGRPTPSSGHASLPRSHRSVDTHETAATARSGGTFGSRSDSGGTDELASAVISHASVAPHAAASLLVSSHSSHGHGTHGRDPTPELASSAFGKPAVEGAYEPVRRSGSFLRRMTEGLGSLRLGAARRAPPDLDVRDPTTPPALWPIDSRPYFDADGLDADSAALSVPRLGAQAQDQAHVPSRASLASIQSARSMRDMVVVLREPSEGTATDVVIEHADEAEHDAGDADGYMLESDADAQDRQEKHEHPVPVSAPAAISDLAAAASFQAGAQEPATIEPDATPSSAVFDGNAFASPPRLPSFTVPRPEKASRQMRSAAPSPSPSPVSGQEALASTTPARPEASDIPTALRPARSSPAAAVSPGPPSSPASSVAAPVRPSLSLSDPSRARTPSPPSPPPDLAPTPTRTSASPFAPRRPVRDVVQSINRRSAASLASLHSSQASATGTPPRLARAPDVFSPAASHSPGPDERRKRSTYEAVRKAEWVVANPDARGGASGSGSGSS